MMYMDGVTNNKMPSNQTIFDTFYLTESTIKNKCNQLEICTNIVIAF